MMNAGCGVMNDESKPASHHSSLRIPRSSFENLPRPDDNPVNTFVRQAGVFLMSLFGCLKWPEMRGAALELIARVREGHARGRFQIPVVDFLRVFAPGAREAELAKVARRGDLRFEADTAAGGSFALEEGARADFDLRREGLVMRVPRRLSGRYELLADSFRVDFNQGEELEGCKRLVVLVCNRVRRVEVTPRRVDVHLNVKMLDLCVEFE
jgi:hypothetical protein